jgi:erythromycin esterase-like protein
LGEASHGTHEFCCERAEITKRLITEKNFVAVAVEADWPDAYRLNRYIRGASDDVDAVEALADFRRFPTWMWRNEVVVEFIEWLRAYNDALPQGAEKVGFYGLDLYSLHASMKAVLHYLEKVDPEAAKAARERYSCFDHFYEDTQAYGLMTRLNLSKSCEEEVVNQLIELQRRAVQFARSGGQFADDELFYAEQNARLVKNAEAYYRSVLLEEVSSWNLRDRHMAETLDALVTHLGRKGRRASLQFGSIILISATHARRKWASAASSMPASSRVRSMAMRRYWSASPLTTARSRPLPIGANRPNANAFARRWPAATRRYSIPQGATGSCLSRTTATRWRRN